MESGGQSCCFALAASPIYRQFSVLAVPEVLLGEGFEILDKNHKAEEMGELLPARSCPFSGCLERFPLKYFGSFRLGGKSCQVCAALVTSPFPAPSASLAGRYAREGLARFEPN